MDSFPHNHRDEIYSTFFLNFILVQPLKYFFNHLTNFLTKFINLIVDLLDYLISQFIGFVYIWFIQTATNNNNNTTSFSYSYNNTTPTQRKNIKKNKDKIFKDTTCKSSSKSKTDRVNQLNRNNSHNKLEK